MLTVYYSDVYCEHLRCTLQWSIYVQRSVHHKIKCTDKVSEILVGFDMVGFDMSDHSAFDSVAIADGATNKSLQKSGPVVVVWSSV